MSLRFPQWPPTVVHRCEGSELDTEASPHPMLDTMWVIIPELGNDLGQTCHLFPAPWTSQRGSDTQLTCRCEKKPSETSPRLLVVGPVPLA